jgi:hypothetical protein
MERMGRTNTLAIVMGLAIVGLGLLTRDVRAQVIDQALEQRIAKEKEDRRDCKIKVCDAALNKRDEGGDIACKVVGTMTVPKLKEKILKGRIEWPFGHAQCSTEVKLPRKTLAKILAGGEVEAAVDKHDITCTLDQKDGQDKYLVSFSIRPLIKFKDGKAIKAAMNWSDIQGSALAKGAVWSTATLDNYVGIFEGSVAESINDFFTTHCEEVRGEVAKR